MTTTSAVGAGTQPQAMASKSSTIGADFNMFLKLLTTQMQHQDPLDPMETSEYTQQLVQYTQVEQTVKQTDTLNDILTRLNAQGMSEASAYIGREVRFDSPVSGLGERPASWTYEVDGSPAKIVATVRDEAGRVVHEQEVDGATGRFSWDGTLPGGRKAPDGAYRLTLEAVALDGTALESTINSVGVVKDVVTNGNAVLLGVNGLRFPTGSLLAVAAAPPAAA